MSTLLWLLFGIGVVINIYIFRRLQQLTHDVIDQAERMNESCTDIVQANQEISRNLAHARDYFDNVPPEV